MAEMRQSGRSWHGTAGVVPLLPPQPVQIASQLSREMCFAALCTMRSCPGVVLLGGRCLCLRALSSALVRNFQAGLSEVMPLQSGPKSPVRRGDLLYPAMEPAPRMWLLEAAVGCIPAERPLAGAKQLWGPQSLCSYQGMARGRRLGGFPVGAHPVAPLPTLACVGLSTHGSENEQQPLMPLDLYNPMER